MSDPLRKGFQEAFRLKLKALFIEYEAITPTQHIVEQVVKEHFPTMFDQPQKELDDRLQRVWAEYMNAARNVMAEFNERFF